MVASRAPPTGDLGHNPGTCPDWELNWQPFGSQAGPQSTGPHQPEQNTLFFDVSFRHSVFLWQLSFQTGVQFPGLGNSFPCLPRIPSHDVGDWHKEITVVSPPMAGGPELGTPTERRSVNKYFTVARGKNPVDKCRGKALNTMTSPVNVSVIYCHFINLSKFSSRKHQQFIISYPSVG